MIESIKQWLKARWPRLRLRTILFATLFFVAALPGIGAVFLRVYENTLVRQTEAELVAQATVLAASAALVWPGAGPEPQLAPTDLKPESPQIDLSTTPILAERPQPRFAGRPEPAARATAIRLAPVLARTRQVTLASPFLLDANGRITDGPMTGGSHAELPEVRAALAGRPATVLRRTGSYRAVYWFEWLSRAAAIRVHHARPIEVNGRVVGVVLLSRSARALFRGIYEDGGKIALGIAAIFSTLLALTALLSRSIARPVEALSAVTRSVAGGRGHVPPPPRTAAIEIQDLYRDFALMAAAIDRRSRYLRDFAHAVSHEFKTPLAGIRGALELVGEHDMTPHERARFLANADADAVRLQLLVTRLLELARADMSAVPAEVATDLAAVTASVAKAATTADFAVALDLPPLPPVAVPAASLERMLTTMVENSRQAGATRVDVTASAAGGAVCLRIADDGSGIPPADRERVFEPFFTTRRTDGGSGLGLPIVRSLLDAAGGEIALLPSTAGATFALTLPLSH
ncbi:MAG: two-component sensor histidine kinase [Sphingomonas bacterium]|uniref:sensor histidine kinase n=1 Tax=Sphingomonas bacterium TaxID=1895847 RepID=UPI002603FD32|nr:HAMP domain-containing sensor histidine kinase [Sphingomonas bacterium]MDB5696007.1 two-component sensor histidine kinase [Sphingomonas bacterium]